MTNTVFPAFQIQYILDYSSEATSLDWKSQCLENPSVPLLQLADKKLRIYRV
jgi:hypothetical protein